MVNTMKSGGGGGAQSDKRGGGWLVDFDSCGKRAKDVLCAAVKQPNDDDKSIGELKVTATMTITTTMASAMHIFHLVDAHAAF
jgi:hypothetical protein